MLWINFSQCLTFPFFQITYKFVEGCASCQSFSLDEATGIVTSKKTFGKVDPDNFRLDIYARDGKAFTDNCEFSERNTNCFRESSNIFLEKYVPIVYHRN